MKKFIVSAAVMEATGFRYIPLRECESYEDAEIAYKAYKRRNPGLSVLIEHVLREETPVTNFQRITRSPEALAAFLRSLSVLSAPWDDAFHSRVCDGCEAEDCDSCRREERDNPLWWLDLAAEGEESTETREPTLPEVAREYLRICDRDCGGDRSVGLPPCPFFEEPDITGDGKAIPGGCRLREYREEQE